MIIRLLVDTSKHLYLQVFTQMSPSKRNSWTLCYNSTLQPGLQTITHVLLSVYSHATSILACWIKAKFKLWSLNHSWISELLVDESTKATNWLLSPLHPHYFWMPRFSFLWIITFLLPSPTSMPSLNVIFSIYSCFLVVKNRWSSFPFQAS